MSLTIFFFVLSIVSAALADDHGPSVADDTSTAPGLDDRCTKLNMVNETHMLTPADFKSTLEYCSGNSESSKTLNPEARVLLQVFDAIRKYECYFTGHTDVEEKLIDCVKKATKTPSYAVANATSSFGMDNTFSLKFGYNECKKSIETSNCVEKVFSEKKWDANMKNCKDNVLRGFTVTSKVCIESKKLLRDNRGSGSAILPTKSLIVSAVFVLVKVIACGF